MKGIIVGFGNMGKTHLERYKQLGVDVIITEIDADKMSQAKNLGLDVYNSLSEIPNMDNLTFIDICTPTNQHFKNLLDAIKYKKPIFIEKPIVLTNEEVKKLRKLNYKGIIFVGEIEQYNPDLEGFFSYNGVPTRIDISRRINLDFFLQGTKPWFLDESLSGGIVSDAMIHDLNMVITKYGKPEIRGVNFKINKYNCPDEVKVKLSFKNLEINLYCTWVAHDLKTTPIIVNIEILEENGNKMVLNCDSYIIRDKPKEQDAFYREIKAFLDSIKRMKNPFKIEDYLLGIEVANQIRERINYERNIIN